MTMIFKGVLALVWLILIPAAAGIPLCSKKEDGSMGMSLVLGTVFLYFVMECITLPMIAARTVPLWVLTGCYGVVSIGMAIWGLLILRKRGAETCLADLKARILAHATWYLAAAVVLILIQMAVVVFWMYTDADDAFYVATATTGLHTDTIMSINPYTGFPYRTLLKRYVLSPFPVLLSVLCRLCGNLHPAVMAHVILPPVLLGMSYLVLYRLGRLFFPEDKEGQGIFLLLAAVLTWFSGFTVYTSGTFQIIRIWQGKALLAGLLLPFLFSFGVEYLFVEKEKVPWYILLFIEGAACFLSSMGIFLAPLMTGLLLLTALIRNRDVKQFFAGLACCLPCVFLGVMYLFL